MDKLMTVRRKRGRNGSWTAGNEADKREKREKLGRRLKEEDDQEGARRKKTFCRNDESNE